jgi:NAD(P)-dependent dehydrogenase (short-subunit alcohol dehydrogenase family)
MLLVLDVEHVHLVLAQALKLSALGMRLLLADIANEPLKLLVEELAGGIAPFCSFCWRRPAPTYLQAKAAQPSASTPMLRTTSMSARFRCAHSTSLAQFTYCATVRAFLASGSRSGESFVILSAAPPNMCAALWCSTWERSKEEWEWVLGVNLWGTINTIRHFVPRMVSSNAKYGGPLTGAHPLAGGLGVLAASMGDAARRRDMPGVAPARRPVPAGRSGSWVVSERASHPMLAYRRACA